jgi:hypothetical protein
MVDGAGGPNSNSCDCCCSLPQGLLRTYSLHCFFKANSAGPDPLDWSTKQGDPQRGYVLILDAENDQEALNKLMEIRLP